MDKGVSKHDLLPKLYTCSISLNKVIFVSLQKATKQLAWYVGSGDKGIKQFTARKERNIIKKTNIF